VKFFKFLETRRCLSVPSITYGNVSNLVEVPICFRSVTSKIMKPCRIVAIQVWQRSSVLDCYDLKISYSLGSLLTRLGLWGSVGDLIG